MRRKPVKLICKTCGKEFKAWSCEIERGKKYCNQKCYGMSLRKRKILICQVCGKNFEVRSGKIKYNAKYCSIKCQAIGRRKGKVLHCRICGKEFYQLKSRIRYGKENYCSPKCRNERNGKSLSKNCLICGRVFIVPPSWSRQKYCSAECKYIGNSGKNSCLWKGGSTKFGDKIRRRKEYQEWRRKILERDNFTCQKCGIKAETGDGIYLHAHHIKSFSKYLNLRFDINNGMTLCSSCHEKEHGFKFPKYVMGMN